jgi:hypothetical protein
MRVVTERAQIVTSTAGSLALEGLEAGPEVAALLDRWAAGEASDEDLREAERRVLAGEPLDDLLAPAAPPGAPRAA